MIDCLIIGDSIARGVAQAAPLECSSLTHVGINSREFNRRYNTRDFIAKTVVISLGSNDYRGIHTQRELRAVRARVIGKHVIWILPHGVAPGSGIDVSRVHGIVRSIAGEYGDQVLAILQTGPDGVHPTAKEYKAIGEHIKPYE